MRQPKVFLFDEPLSNLDAKLRGDMRREIARIHQGSNATAMYVTHDQIEAMTLADLIVVLKDGVDRSRSARRSRSTSGPRTGSSPGSSARRAMNFLDADVTAAPAIAPARPAGPGSRSRSTARRELSPARDRAIDRIVVGIRPERLSLVQRGDDVALSGEVAMREVLGAEVVLHLESPAGPLTIRTDAGSAPRPGDTVQVWLDPHAIHVFDGATEVRL